MSGICAVWWQENPERVGETLASISGGLCLASERLEQRTAHGAGVALARRFETQQLYENPNVLIACDADLYNEGELARLCRGGQEVPSSSKTAALLAGLYEQFGADFVQKLEGAFSLVLWDRRQKRLLAAIDGFGIKRLVYYQDQMGLLIASRVDALAKSDQTDLEVNPRAIANILNFTANAAPETIFTKVHRMAPGTLLMASEGSVQLTRYWDMQYGLAGDSEARLARRLEEVFERSVALHCKHDSFAKVGAFLSGGTDSSTVVGMMGRMGKGRPKAFSIGFREQPFNELGYAEIAARKFDAEHFTYLVGPEDCADALPEMIRYFDEPFGNSSAIPTYFCARLAAENGVKFLLAGDGGDELFGGNERYATDKIFELYHHLPEILRKGLLEPVLSRFPVHGGVVAKARGYVRRANMPSLERYFSFQLLRTHAPEDVFEADFLSELKGYTILDIPAHHYAQAPARDHLNRLLYLDMKMTLADNDLPKVTCMSELAGVQTRFPFLDRTVAECAGHIPARLKVKGFEKRYLFKRAFRNLLPIEIIQKKKHGFGIPVSTWIKSDPRIRELSRDTLLSARAFERGYFRRSFIEDLFRKHEADETSYYGDALWTFLTLELWHRQVVDNPASVIA